MDEVRIKSILARFSELRILVMGDFFLDLYLVTDPRLSEISLETGLEARQVVEVRSSPGAAGTVACNLARLGLRRVQALGVVGKDGHGYELTEGLRRAGVSTELVLQAAERATPAYIKPMRRLAQGGEEELERMDLKNRRPLPAPLEEALVERLRAALTEVQGVVVADQVQEPDCGVITERVREEICRLALEHPEKIFFADSRAHIGKFRNVWIKPNEKEAREAVSERGLALEEVARRLQRRTGRPLFLTCGAGGMLVCDGERCQSFPALAVRGPIDPVGAGDSATAAMVAALCAGASPGETAQLGNLAASVTLHKMGTTGTASAAEILEVFHP